MGNLKALILGDNQELLQTLKHLIEGPEVECLTMENGLHAIYHIVENKNQIVIVNEKMTDTNAQDFIIKASQEKLFSTTTFILVSKNEFSEMDKMKFMTLGYSYFLSKQLNSSDQTILKQCIFDELNILKQQMAA